MAVLLGAQTARQFALDRGRKHHRGLLGCRCISGRTMPITASLLEPSDHVRLGLDGVERLDQFAPTLAPSAPC